MPKMGLPSPTATINASEQKAGQPATNSTTARSETHGSLAAEMERGRAHEDAGNLDKARKVYEDLLKRHPESVSAAHALGVVSDKQGRHSEAEQLFLFALQREPRNAEMLNDLGYCYFLQGRLDKSEAAIVKATTLQPTNPRFRNNLGLVLGHQRRYEDAFTQFSQTGSEAAAYYNMAFIFAAQELPDEAKGCFQQALDIDPNYQPAREALASFEAFDRLPPEMQQEEAKLADNGVRYVPFIEGAGQADGVAENGGVQPASAATPLPANREAGRNTRALLMQSRDLFKGHMQSQRNAQNLANGAGTNEAQ